MTSVVSFTKLEDATAEDLSRVVPEDLGAHMADNLLNHLRAGAGPTHGYQVDRFTHALQTATRAEREGARQDLVIGALFHDVADTLAPLHHGQVAASILEPYIDEETTWVVRHHTVFLGYHFWDKLGLDPTARDRYRDSPHFDAAAQFVEWDQASFDGGFQPLPLEYFEPMVRDAFRSPRGSSGPLEQFKGPG